MNKSAAVLLRYLQGIVMGILCNVAFAGTLSPQDFNEETLTQLHSRYQGQPFVLVLWSAHCAPCLAELKMLGKELVRHPDLPLVLISTDEPGSRDEVRMLLEDYGLESFVSWQFAGDFPEKLRYLIDPDWFGELPRSYFYTADGQREPHSGVISREMLLQWLEL